MKTYHKYTPQPHYFTNYQRWISILIVTLYFQLPFFFVIGLTIYSLITFNFEILMILGLVILASLPVKRSETYINFIRKYVVPTAYPDKFERIFDEQIPDDAKKLFCFHPHSVFAYCIMGNMNCGNDPMTNMTGLASRFIFNIPLTGLIFRLYGVRPVDPGNLKQLMKESKPIGLLPGGFEEATLTTPSQLRVFIKNRFGFIKYALQYGYTIYPCLTFNEHKQYWTLDYFRKLRLKLNKFKFPAVIFISKWLLFLDPSFQMITVVGKGLKLTSKTQDKQNQQELYQPTKEEVHQIHQKYIKQIERLYNKYKHLNGNVQMVLY